MLRENYVRLFFCLLIFLCRHSICIMGETWGGEYNDSHLTSSFIPSLNPNEDSTLVGECGGSRMDCTTSGWRLSQKQSLDYISVFSLFKTNKFLASSPAGSRLSQNLSPQCVCVFKLQRLYVCFYKAENSEMVSSPHSLNWYSPFYRYLLLLHVL